MNRNRRFAAPKGNSCAGRFVAVFKEIGGFHRLAVWSGCEFSRGMGKIPQGASEGSGHTRPALAAGLGLPSDYGANSLNYSFC